METLFLEEDLPLADLEKLGLYRDGKLLMDAEDLSAMLAGRRTELISLENLHTDGFRIEKLDAKLSLDRSPDAKITIQLHPIYKEAQKHELLGDKEAQSLINGQTASISKTYPDSEGREKKVVIEYDPQTREFVSYDPGQVLAPDRVNGEQLKQSQKDDFRNGNIVNLADGTRLQHRATERRGLLSDRQALVLSVLLDGGISYLLIRGIKNLLGNREAQKDEYTQGYAQALQDIEAHGRKAGQQQLQQLSGQDQRNDYSRGYGRSKSR